MRKLVRLLSVIVILIAQAQAILQFRQQQTAAAEHQSVSILDGNEYAHVKASAEKGDNEIEWTFKYSRAADDAAYPRALRLKVTADEEGKQPLNYKEGDMPNPEDEYADVDAEWDQWFRETPSEDATEGDLVLTSPLDVQRLYVWVQVDEWIAGKESELLTEDAAEVKELETSTVLPDVDTEETPELQPDPEPETSPETEQPGVGDGEEVEDDDSDGEGVPEQPEGEDVGDTDTSTEDDAENSEEEVSDSDVKNGVSLYPDLPIPDVLTAIGDESDLDPFEYPVNNNPGANEYGGKYPLHSTNDILEGHKSENTKNYSYGEPDNQLGVPAIKSLLKDDAYPFDSGYHQYNDQRDADAEAAYTKATVQATQDDEFEVQLSMVARQVSKLPQADIILVLDRPRRKGNNEAETWKKWRKMISDFARDLLVPKRNVRIGLVGCSVEIVDSSYSPYTDIAIFSGSADEKLDFRYFTDDYNELMQSPLLNENPNTGTQDKWHDECSPLFFGVETALAMLEKSSDYSNPGVYKQVITIARGGSGVRPRNAYFSYGDIKASAYAGYIGGNLLGMGRTIYLSFGRRTLRNKFYVGTMYIQGGYSNNMSLNRFKEHRITNVVKEYSKCRISGIAIGFELSSLDTNGEEALKTLSWGNNFEYIPEVDSVDFFNKVKEAVGVDKTSVSGAQLVDEVSNEFEVVADSVSQEFVQIRDGTAKYGDMNSNITDKYSDETSEGHIVASDDKYKQLACFRNVTVTLPTSTNNKITVDNISLPEGSAEENVYNGYRIKYRIRLKDEFRGWQFYPISQKIMLTNKASPNSRLPRSQSEYLHFAIPSVMEGNHRQITISKVWTDDENNKWGTRQDALMLIERKTTTGEWTEFESVKLPADEENVSFIGLRKNVRYRIREVYHTDVTSTDYAHLPGYALPMYLEEDSGDTNGEFIFGASEDEKTVHVTNRLLMTKYRFTKVDGKRVPLAGAMFGGENLNGTQIGVTPDEDTGTVFETTSVPVGEYNISEIGSPVGYMPSGDFQLKVTSEMLEDTIRQPELKVESTLKNNEVVNYQPELRIIKVNGDRLLPGAHFSVTGGNVTYTGITDEAGILRLDGVDDFLGLSPGEYTIKETQAPEGFIKLKGTFTLTINDAWEDELVYAGDDEHNLTYTNEMVQSEPGKNEAPYYQIKIGNTPVPASVLPETGSVGWLSIFLLGVILLIVAFAGDKRWRFDHE